MKMKIKIHEKTSFTYKGINIEIVKWDIDMLDEIQVCWNYYLWFEIDKFPKEIAKKLWKPKDQYNIELNNLDWHYGMTYYSARYSQSWKTKKYEKHIQVGCDYQHHWDRGVKYDFEIIATHARKCVDSFIEQYPSYGTTKTTPIESK